MAGGRLPGAACGVVTGGAADPAREYGSVRAGRRRGLTYSWGVGEALGEDGHRREQAVEYWMKPILDGADIKKRGSARGRGLDEVMLRRELIRRTR